MLFNILHLENPVSLLGEANLEDGRQAWNYDPKTPGGPSMDIRPKPEDCLKWAESAGFRGAVRYDLKPYHCGIVLIKKEEAK